MKSGDIGDPMISKCAIAISMLGSWLQDLPYKIHLVQDVESFHDYETGEDVIVHVYPKGQRTTADQRQAFREQLKKEGKEHLLWPYRYNKQTNRFERIHEHSNWM